MDTQVKTNNINNETGLSPETENQMKLRYLLLPENIQNMIKDATYNTALIEITRENKLTYEDLETLQLETAMALFGLSTLDEYTDAVTDALKKPAEQMNVIIKSLMEKIFDPIKDSLQKFYQTVDEEIAKTETEDVESGDIQEDVLSDEIPSEALQNANPFTGTLNTMPAPEVSAGTVIPIKTSPVVLPVQTQPVSSSPQFVSNIATNNIPSGRVLSPNEKRVLGSTGIELSDSQNKMNVPEIEESMLPNRNDLMAGIENPVKVAPASNPTPAPVSPTIVANKLTMSTTLMPNKTTDYSISKSTPQNQSNTKASGDPYREAV
ncbi:MAG: hypothetical protein WCO65_03040 [bacterium]